MEMTFCRKHKMFRKIGVVNDAWMGKGIRWAQPEVSICRAETRAAAAPNAKPNGRSVVLKQFCGCSGNRAWHRERRHLNFRRIA